MDQRQRLAQQRALAAEAIGKLKAVTEFFGAERPARTLEQENNDFCDYETWSQKIEELESWIFNESPIA